MLFPTSSKNYREHFHLLQTFLRRAETDSYATVGFLLIVFSTTFQIQVDFRKPVFVTYHDKYHTCISIRKAWASSHHSRIPS
ncbi:unnamed protein product [Trichobilharzia szidati]|nr:unnamed protein product [Trichobilharzia szidati]